MCSEVVFHVDVVVDVHPGLLPLGELVALSGERLQGRLVKLLEEGAPASPELLEGAAVEIFGQWPYGQIQFGRAEEDVVPEWRQDPALDHSNR